FTTLTATLISSAVSIANGWSTVAVVLPATVVMTRECTRSPRVDALEAFGRVACWEPGRGGDAFAPLAQQRLHRLTAAVHLALVAEQCLDLAGQHFRRVDEAVRHAARHEPEFGHRVRLEPFIGEQLGEGPGVAGVGVYGAERRLGRGEVVGM